jgi:hypothetical protein
MAMTTAGMLNALGVVLTRGKRLRTVSGLESQIAVMSARMSMSSSKAMASKLERIKLLEEKKQLKEGLPHLHGFKHFWWSRQYFESTNRLNFLTSGNQCTKSSCQIRKVIHWCTEPKLWPKLWPGRKPTYFFYVYPSKELATREFNHKWIPEFLPRGSYKDHPQYGWKAEFKNHIIQAVHFNSGVSIIFLSYAMSPQDLQASSPSAVFCDEEIPVEIYPELVMRLEASKGHFHLACTPTLGQPFFQEIFEKKRLEEAFVLTVSMYDCLTYEDGSPGLYTLADIKRREAMLGTQAEIDTRIFGKFVKTEGLMYPSFDKRENLQPAEVVPSDWLWYSGTDVGSSGMNHPAAICFVAVSPDFKQARVVECWRGNQFETTTAEDILRVYIRLRGERVMAGEYYDWASKDFHTIAMRAGVPMQPADKTQATGQNLLNTLLKNRMLMIDDVEANETLVEEFQHLRVDTKKRNARDDQVDSLRYAITNIPFDFSDIQPAKPEVLTVSKPKTAREEQAELEKMLRKDEIDAEIEAWNEIMEGY